LHLERQEMADQNAPSRDEIAELQKWLEENKSSFPESVSITLQRMVFIYVSLSQSAGRAKHTLTRLREALGILPKSERGKSDKLSSQAFAQGELNLESLSSADRAQYDKIQALKRRSLQESAEYGRELRSMLPPAKNPHQLEFALQNPLEMVFSSPSSERTDNSERRKVDRVEDFENPKGLHASYDETKRVDLQILVTDIKVQVETVTDPRTGKSVRASVEDFGPEGSTMTWRTIANLVKLVVGFAIPINRLSLVIGQPEFTSSQICRVLRWAATLFMPIYLHLAEELSESTILSGDDTKTKILDLTKGSEDALSHQIDEHLGWSWPKADQTGDKKALNVSLLMGRSARLDPRSTIAFFRTHLGSVGNLLTRLLEWRKPKSGALIFQGDLSTTNLPTEALRKKFNLLLAGCGAHARRPFWRYRDEDPLFCYFMLRGFLKLARIEKRIDRRGRTQANVIYMRNRYSRKIWIALRNRCLAATQGHSAAGRFTFRHGETTGCNIWPPGTELHSAAKYIVNHFEKLTRYLDNPFLKYTNNGAERALRIEKCYLSSSKFTKTRNGRAVIDILRTINATCTAAEVDLTAYFRYVSKNRQQLHKNPELFTPYAFALELQRLNTKLPKA
jgi:hypothetical protein